MFFLVFRGACSKSASIDSQRASYRIVFLNVQERALTVSDSSSGFRGSTSNRTFMLNSFYGDCSDAGHSEADDQHKLVWSNSQFLPTHPKREHDTGHNVSAHVDIYFFTQIFSCLTVFRVDIQHSCTKSYLESHQKRTTHITMVGSKILAST